MTCPPHHYVLPSEGATVVGRCRACGAERAFQNRALDTRRDPRTHDEMAAERQERYFEAITYRQAVMETEDMSGRG